MSSNPPLPDGSPVSSRRRPGAPIGNTNAVKHGRRSRTRGQALKLIGVLQQVLPECLDDPKLVPEPLAAVLVALVERDKAVEEAITRRNRRLVHLNMGLIERVRQIQDRFEENGSPFPKTLEIKQPTTINPRKSAKKQ